MAINRGEIPFLGTHGGLCGYYAHGLNIVRAASSLTGERTEKDPAFEGFRQSGNRMKAASPIAAALYNRIPAEQRKYSFYRLLTGEALKLVKQGLDKTIILEILQKQVDTLMESIDPAGDPVLQRADPASSAIPPAASPSRKPVKKRRKPMKSVPAFHSRFSGKSLFAFPPVADYKRRLKGNRHFGLRILHGNKKNETSPPPIPPAPASISRFAER